MTKTVKIKPMGTTMVISQFCAVQRFSVGEIASIDTIRYLIFFKSANSKKNSCRDNYSRKYCIMI